MLSKSIKVLWYTNTPSLAAEFLNTPAIGGGWINSLEEKIKENENISLAVAFKHGQKELNKFSLENTTYYAIPNKNSKLTEIIKRHHTDLNDNQLVEYCLEIIEDFKPDIINIFGTEEGYGLIIDKINIPVVIHLQGILTIYALKWFSGNITKADLISHSNLKSFLRADSLLHNYNNFKKAAEREREIFNICQHFMGRTDWDRRITSVLAPTANYYHSNEILRSVFHYHSWQRNSGSKLILISTIQANIYKGLETILETAVLLKSLSLVSFEWMVAGISQNDIIVKIFEKKLRREFKDYNVNLIGKLGEDDLVKNELEADIFIHPSHIDNSPNSICEAMLLGMPIIATSTGGTSSLLIDKKEGLLIQDGDPYSLAGAILELFKDPDYATKLGKNARVRAMKRHNPAEIVQNIANVYATILNQIT